MNQLLCSLIYENLLLEEVFGAQAFVYHGSTTPPAKFINYLINDEFVAGKGAGSIYGKGLYAVTELTSSAVNNGMYGKYIYKLKINLHGFISFDNKVTKKIYKRNLTPSQQAAELNVDEDIIEVLKKINQIPRSANEQLTHREAKFASKYLNGKVKGIIFTAPNDGQVVVVYDPSIIVPVSWKNIDKETEGIEKWTKINMNKLRPALRRSAIGDWKKERYDIPSSSLLSRLEKLPVEERKTKQNIDLEGYATDIALPDFMEVFGNVNLSKSKITKLPKGLVVHGHLDISDTAIEVIPNDLKVSDAISADRSKIKTIEDGFTTGDLILTMCHITELPNNLVVKGNLMLRGTYIKHLPDDLSVKGKIFGFFGNTNEVAPKLKKKLYR
jgi:hypothetical protein